MTIERDLQIQRCGWSTCDLPRGSPASLHGLPGVIIWIVLCTKDLHHALSLCNQYWAQMWSQVQAATTRTRLALVGGLAVQCMLNHEKSPPISESFAQRHGKAFQGRQLAGTAPSPRSHRFCTHQHVQQCLHCTMPALVCNPPASP